MEPRFGPCVKLNPWTDLPRSERRLNADEQIAKATTSVGHTTFAHEKRTEGNKGNEGVFSAGVPLESCWSLCFLLLKIFCARQL